MIDTGCAAIGAWLAAHGPLAAIGLTLAAYLLAQRLWQASGQLAILNPTLIGILAAAGVLQACRIDPAAFAEATRMLHLLLGPAVVALAVPLHRNLGAIQARAASLAGALGCGSVVAVLSVMGLAAAFGLGPATLLSLAPKSTTTAVSMAVSAEIGGIAALTAVATVTTGILCAVFGPALLDLLRIADPITRGAALGLAGHAIGTARALQEGELAGMAAGLAMGLNALLTALLVPALLLLLR
jgi:putative effector of murein hydrolase